TGVQTCALPIFANWRRPETLRLVAARSREGQRQARVALACDLRRGGADGLHDAPNVGRPLGRRHQTEPRYGGPAVSPRGLREPVIDRRRAGAPPRTMGTHGVCAESVRTRFFGGKRGYGPRRDDTQYLGAAGCR